MTLEALVKDSEDHISPTEGLEGLLSEIRCEVLGRPTVPMGDAGKLTALTDDGKEAGVLSAYAHRRERVVRSPRKLRGWKTPRCPVHLVTFTLTVCM